MDKPKSPGALREQARRLDGMFNLHDSAGNDIREAWSREADELRAEADRIEAAAKGTNG